MKFSNEYIEVDVKNKPKMDVSKILGISEQERLRCRDPFIMPYDGKYYLYKNAVEKGVQCLVSEDLTNWSEPIMVFETPKDFHGCGSWFWAPECHYYKGYFYIFTSVKSAKYDGRRTISVYRADNPLGPFEDIADGAISPTDWDAIDGTLYIDKQGAPWMVFVHEWTSMPDKNGGMVAARLSEDFTRFISEPITLFYAKDPDWATDGITDGPFLYRTEKDTLYMIWSNFSAKGYAIGLAKSSNGEIDGNWSQEGLLYQKDMRKEFVFDGGHGMIFKRNDGVNCLTLHCPNGKTAQGDFEHLNIFTIVEKNDMLEIEKKIR